MFNSKNFQREIFCRSREIFVEAGSFDNHKTLTIMLYWCAISLRWCRKMAVHKCYAFRFKRKNLLSLTPACCPLLALRSIQLTSNGSWCMGIKGEMSDMICVTFAWDMYLYELFIAFVCFCCLFINVTWWYVLCIVWASGNEEKVLACLVTLCQFVISCYSLYKTNTE